MGYPRVPPRDLTRFALSGNTWVALGSHEIVTLRIHPRVPLGAIKGLH